MTRQPTLCLSIRQPWAWLIFHGGKDVENRSWPTTLRGRVLIHAAKGCSADEWLEAYWFADRISHDLSEMIPPRADLERGGIVGEVAIIDCVTQHSSPWFCGPFGFVLSAPRLFRFHPCKGALGFFRLDSQQERP